MIRSLFQTVFARGGTSYIMLHMKWIRAFASHKSWHIIFVEI